MNAKQLVLFILILLNISCSKRPKGLWYFIQAEKNTKVRISQNCISINFKAADTVWYNDGLSAEEHGYLLLEKGPYITLQSLEDSLKIDTISIDWNKDNIMRICYFKNDSINFCGFFQQEKTANCQ